MENLDLSKKEIITSLELVEQINYFRQQEGNKNELRHDTLLNITRDEFQEEISLQKILESTYKNSRRRNYPMFILTLAQAKQVLFKESKYVRKAIIKYIEKLENKLSNNLPRTFAEALKLAYEQQLHIEKQNTEIGSRIV